MKPNEFMKEVIARESNRFEKIKLRITNENIRLLHAGMGMCTEAGEYLDTMKKVLYYGAAIDKTNLIEELGDILWYVGVAADTLGVSFEEIMEINSAKLNARYGDAFSTEKALERDLKHERDVLEESTDDE